MARGISLRGSLGLPEFASPRPSLQEIADLAQRAAEPLTITQKACGDPPPSRSALALKGMAVQPYYMNLPSGRKRPYDPRSR